MTDAHPEVDARLEIEALLHRYAELVDAGDFAAVGELFAHATLRADVGGTVVTIGEGAEAGRRNFDGVILYDDGTPRTKHVTTNVIVDVDPDGARATARSYFTVLQAVPGALPLQPVIAGRYHDAFEHVGGRWRFTDRVFLTDLLGDLGHHLRPGVL